MRDEIKDEKGEREREREDTEAHEKQRTEKRAFLSPSERETQRGPTTRIFFSFFTLYSYTFFPNTHRDTRSLFLLLCFCQREEEEHRENERRLSFPRAPRAIFAFVDFFFEKE